MNPVRPDYFVSDHTGITAEIIGKSLLSQYPGEAFAFVSVPFVDSAEKAREAAERIRAAGQQAGHRPLVFSTLTDAQARATLDGCGALVLDIYAHFLGLLTEELGRPAIALRGRFHGVDDPTAYGARIDAVNYTLATDDGLSTEKYALADLILVGVSRSGKTPTSLYLAMQHGLRVANYPLTPENFDGSTGSQPGLPASLLPHRDKLRGLTLSAERLARIRAERRPNSRYASPETCRQELAAAESLLRSEDIPVIDTSQRSVEEIAAMLKQSLIL